MLKTLVKCVSKTAEEKLSKMPPVGEITVERMTDIRKPSKTLKPLKSKTILTLFSVHRPVCYGQNRLEIKRLPREGRIMKLEHSMHLLCRGK